MSLNRRGRGFGGGLGAGGSSSGNRITSAPWGRLKPVQQDPLEAMGLPSKGDTRLLDRKAQAAYFDLIVARYMTFCADSGSGSALSEHFASLNLAPAAATLSASLPTASAASASTSTPAPRAELERLLAALRKLREALIATGPSSTRACAREVVSFQQSVYIFSIRFSLLLSHHASYAPALTHLLETLHAWLPLSPPHLQEFAGYLVLDLACRRGDLAAAYRARWRWQVRERRVNETLRCVTHGDYVIFWKLTRAVDGYQARLLQWAAGEMRATALKCLGRGYLGGDQAWVERMCGGLDWDRLQQSYNIGWQLQPADPASGRVWVVMRKPKSKQADAAA